MSPTFVYPARFDQALKTLLDRLVRDGVEPDDSVESAVERVEQIYSMIGSGTREGSSVKRREISVRTSRH